MRCARCGNENLAANRFCGMCGATLLETPASQPQRAATPGATYPAPVTATQAQAVDAHRAAPSVSEHTPSISGPSFLGLNDPGPRQRASLSIDPRSAPSSRNLDYLLDDEEEHRGGGGKFLLILLALALAVGFGYLRWKNHELGWLNLGTHKPTAAVQNSDGPDAASPAPSSPSITPEPDPAAAGQPATPTAQPPADSNSGSAAANPATDATTPGAPPSTTGANSNGSANPATTPDTGSTAAAAPKESGKEAPDAVPAAATKKEAKTEKPVAPAARPSPKPRTPAKTATVAADPVREAQKYLYGRGAPQDCDRGMRLLKPAANQANPKAMIEMGALYSAGLCTPHDLPTAYRWFALALRKDPENQAVKADLQKLWGEMTQPERQLAIKLTE